MKPEHVKQRLILAGHLSLFRRRTGSVFLYEMNTPQFHPPVDRIRWTRFAQMSLKPVFVILDSVSEMRGTWADGISVSRVRVSVWSSQLLTREPPEKRTVFGKSSITVTAWLTVSDLNKPLILSNSSCTVYAQTKLEMIWLVKKGCVTFISNFA